MKNVEKFEDAIPRVNGIYYKLHLAKQEIGKINKSADNPFFKSKYADLNTILDVVEPILHKYNLLLLQPIANGCVQSIVIDIETGEEFISEIKSGLGKQIKENAGVVKTKKVGFFRRILNTIMETF